MGASNKRDVSKSIFLHHRTQALSRAEWKGTEHFFSITPWAVAAVPQFLAVAREDRKNTWERNKCLLLTLVLTAHCNYTAKKFLGKGMLKQEQG